MNLEELLSRYPRLAITGAPRCGKTTLCEQIRDRVVVHTDDWKEWDWREVPALVIGACSQHETFVVEGVRAADAIRQGLEVDAILVLTNPKTEQTPAQINMGAGVATILEQVRQAQPELPIVAGSELVWPTVDRADARPVQRFRHVTLDRANQLERTTVGGVRIRGAVLARPGVFEYDRGGRIIREYSPPEELFDPDSIRTLEGAPVVVDHPYDDGGLVDTTSYRRLQVGHLENPRQDGDLLVGDIVINDAPTVDRVLAHELTEVSLGYTNTRDMTPGHAPDGKPYDLVQRGQTYNHVAIGPDGWSRKNVGFTLDSKDDQTIAPPGEIPMPAPANQEPEKTNNSDVPAPTPAPPPVPAPTPAPALSAEDVAALKEIVAMLPALRQLANSGAPPSPAPAPTTDNGSEEEKEKTADEEEKEKTTDAATQERRIQETVALHKEAERLLGEEYKPAGKSNREIRLDVIKTIDSKFSVDNKTTDESIRAAYNMALNVFSERAKRSESLAALHAGSRTVTTDGEEEESNDSETASQNAWKGPPKA